MLKQYEYTLNEVLELGLLTEWEIANIVFESEEMQHLTFDWAGTLKANDHSVYFVHDPEIKQELLGSKKRRDLLKKFGSAGEKNSTHGCIGRN